MEQGELVVGRRRRHARHRATAATLALLAVLAACSSSGKATSVTSSTATTAAATTVAPTAVTSTAPTSSTTTTAAAPSTSAASSTTPAVRTAPAGDAFFTPPSPLPSGQPGDLIWARPLDAANPPASWQMLYLSQTVDGKPVAVSGVVVAPPGGAATRDVLAWAHATTGLGDSCAISRQYVSGGGVESLIAPIVNSLGLTFVATDYQGLGTPGDHTFVVGQAEGRDVLDAVRAARQLQGAGVTAASRTIIWGHSQGGGAAAFAAELAATYAPELKIIGTMAGAPPGDLPAVLPSLDRSADFGYTLMALDGLHAAYPDLPFDQVLTPKGLAALDTIKDECGDQILSSFAGGTVSDYIKADPTTVPAFATVLKANSAGYVKPAAPMFLYHGDADETVPVGVSKLMLDRYCALGATVERKVYPGGTHVGVITMAVGDLQKWITDRLAGTPAPTSC